MPYEPGKVPMLRNMGQSIFVFELKGVKIKLGPGEQVNLDYLAFGDSTYVNRLLKSIERAGGIAFSAASPSSPHPQDGAPSGFSAKLEILLKEERGKRRKRRGKSGWSELEVDK